MLERTKGLMNGFRMHEKRPGPWNRLSACLPMCWLQIAVPDQAFKNLRSPLANHWWRLWYGSITNGVEEPRLIPPMILDFAKSRLGELCHGPITERNRFQLQFLVSVFYKKLTWHYLVLKKDYSISDWLIIEFIFFSFSWIPFFVVCTACWSQVTFALYKSMHNNLVKWLDLIYASHLELVGVTSSYVLPAPRHTTSMLSILTSSES